MSGTHPQVTSTERLAELVINNGEMTFDAAMIHALFNNNKRNFDQWLIGAGLVASEQYDLGEITLRRNGETTQKV